MNYSPTPQHPSCGTSRDFPAPTSCFPHMPVVAMAYVPFQTDNSTYDSLKGLACGTLFPCLSKPFKGSGTR